MVTYVTMTFIPKFTPNYSLKVPDVQNTCLGDEKHYQSRAYAFLSYCHNGPRTAGAIACRNKILSMKALQFLYSTST